MEEGRALSSKLRNFFKIHTFALLTLVLACMSDVDKKYINYLK